MTIVTDMNQRERARFIQQIEMLHDCSGKLAEALREEDDDALVALVTIVGLIGGPTIQELAKICHEAVRVQMPDDPSDLGKP